MELRAQIIVFRQNSTKFFCDNTGLQTAQTHTQLRRRLTNRRHHIRHRRLAGQIHTPAGNLDARQNDFTVAAPGQFPSLRNQKLQRCRAHRSTGVGDDAIGAEVDTAVLHLQHGTGASLQSAGRKNFKLPAAQGLVQLFKLHLFLCRLNHHFHKFLTVGAAAQHIRIQLPHRRRVVLGVTAADAQHRIGMLLAAAADHRPVFLVRHHGHRAGVDDVAVASFVKLPDFVTKSTEQLLHGLGFILVCFASECIKSKFHSSFSPIF